MVLVSAFRRVGRAVNAASTLPTPDQYLAWIVGSCLFGHSMNFLSVTFWDHSVASFLLLLGAICVFQSELVANGSLISHSSPAPQRSLAASTVGGSSIP
jgi:hypothetical protein